MATNRRDAEDAENERIFKVVCVKFMLSTQEVKRRRFPSRRYLWLERLLAIIAAVNLVLVIFDLSYVPWRDFYFEEAPLIVQYYDPIKGIEPHRETQRYLNAVERLATQVEQTGLQSEETERSLLQLRRLSNEMIEDNPFDVANKTGNLAKIKRLMRARVASFDNASSELSAHEAFTLFWSQLYLSQKDWNEEINFFDSSLRPLIATNYYRDIGENSKLVDKFWLIDSPFIAIFALDFLIRTLYISIRNKLTWLEAMLRRWYDIFLFLPVWFLSPSWRLLRVIPVTIRLYQSRLLNLEPVRSQINHDFVANFAEEITEVVGIRLIDQLQEAIRKGSISRWLLSPNSGQGYVDINNRNEIQAIVNRLIQLSVYQVLPKIQPDIQFLLNHTIQSVLNQSPVYRQIQNVPGMNKLPNQMTERLANDISQAAYSTITNFMEDPVAAKMWERLFDNFSKALEVELQKQHNVQEIQSLIVDLLEEIKINYVQSIAEGGVEDILEESQKIRRIPRK